MEQENLTQVDIIRNIAFEVAMKDSRLLEDFFAIRFPNEQSPSYISEWIKRFQSGNPIAYMDSISRKAFLKAVQLRIKKG